jgi:hypothetical protein
MLPTPRTISRSLFSSTFLVAFALVAANSLVPCPVDHGVANEQADNDKHQYKQPHTPLDVKVIRR